MPPAVETYLGYRITPNLQTHKTKYPHETNWNNSMSNQILGWYQRRSSNRCVCALRHVGGQSSQRQNEIMGLAANSIIIASVGDQPRTPCKLAKRPWKSLEQIVLLGMTADHSAGIFSNNDEIRIAKNCKPLWRTRENRGKWKDLIEFDSWLHHINNTIWISINTQHSARTVTNKYRSQTHKTRLIDDKNYQQNCFADSTIN